VYIYNAVAGDTNWFEDERLYWQVVAPVRAALYANDAGATDSALRDACAAADQLELPADKREILEFLLRWYAFAAAIQNQPAAVRDQRYDEALALFARPAQTPGGEQQRCRLLAILRCNAHVHGCATLAKPELQALIKDLPALLSDEFLWHNIAGWAFATGDTEYLQRAYEVLLTHPSNLLGQAKWQRVNLMLLLHTKRATRADVEFTVRGMVVLPQIIEFHSHLWPVCVAQGLTDPALEELLTRAYERIHADPPVPGLEPRTKHIRGS